MSRDRGATDNAAYRSGFPGHDPGTKIEHFAIIGGMGIYRQESESTCLSSGHCCWAAPTEALAPSSIATAYALNGAIKDSIETLNEAAGCLKWQALHEKSLVK